VIILLFTYKSYAGCLAVTDMIFEADLEFAICNALIVKGKRTGSYLEKLPYQFKQCANCRNRCIRTVIRRAVGDQLPCQKNPWKMLILNAYPGICLVVLQQDIVPGLVFLDEAVLKQQCIGLIIDDNMPEVRSP